MNSTSIRPAYSFFSSSRIGAIILHGMHLPAPRSTSRGSGFVSDGADADVAVGEAGAGPAVTLMAARDRLD